MCKSYIYFLNTGSSDKKKDEDLLNNLDQQFKGKN